jgi:hypothetical protein
MVYEDLRADGHISAHPKPGGLFQLFQLDSKA